MEYRKIGISEYSDIPTFQTSWKFRYSDILEFWNSGVSEYRNIRKFRYSNISDYNIEISESPFRYSPIPEFRNRILEYNFIWPNLRYSGIPERHIFQISGIFRILEYQNIEILEYQNIPIVWFFGLPEYRNILTFRYSGMDIEISEYQNTRSGYRYKTSFDLLNIAIFRNSGISQYRIMNIFKNPCISEYRNKYFDIPILRIVGI